MRLYAFLEDDQIVETRKLKRKRNPYYLTPTATLLMKNTELNRIVDNERRFGEKVTVLKEHYARSRAQKATLSILDF